MNKNSNLVKIINFNEAYIPPMNKYNFNNNIVEWGEKNLYPNYVLQTYNYSGSATHKSIINKKVKLIAGKGFKEIQDPALKKFVQDNKLENEVKKIALDYELFNGFAFEDIYTNDESTLASLKHMPFHKLRIGIKCEDEINYDYHWFSNDWAQYRKKEYTPCPIRDYNPYIKQGKQVYVYNEYNPASNGLYPIIGYSTSMNWIELDFEISQFHLNQAKQGYSPSFILNFVGDPTEEERDEFAKQFKRNYAGTTNSGKIIITYSEKGEDSPELTAVTLNDSDERFIMLMEQIETQIVRGSEIPPQLVILTPGKLGSTDERKELGEEFQNFYITPRQANIEYALNEQLRNAGFKEELKLKKYNEE